MKSNQRNSYEAHQLSNSGMGKSVVSRAHGGQLVRSIGLTMIGFLLFIHADSVRAQNMAKPAIAEHGGKTLRQLAVEKFGSLNPAEELLFDNVEIGNAVDYSGHTDSSSQIRAERISWLCTDPAASGRIGTKGLLIENAKMITGRLSLENAKVPYSLGFRGCIFDEIVVLQKGEFRELDFQQSIVPGIEAYGMKVDGGVLLGRGFEAKGVVDLRRSKIGSYLDCGDGSFKRSSDLNENEPAIQAGEIVVDGGVYLDGGFNAKGRVDLSGARITGELSCRNGTFINERGTALHADSIKVDGRVFLDGEFKAKGGVSIANSVIGGDLVCDKGDFNNPGGTVALNLNSLRTAHDVSLKGSRVEGYLDLRDAVIGVNLYCDGAAFLNRPASSVLDPYESAALDARGLKVGHCVFMQKNFHARGWIRLVSASVETFFIWQGISKSDEIALDLRAATVGTLQDDIHSWPNSGKLALHGFVYTLIEEKSPLVAEARLKWLRLQSNDRFLPQPFEQLAAVLRRQGREDDATEILIAKNDEPAFLEQIGWPWRFFHWVFGKAAGYGYRPWWAFWWSTVWIIAGCGLFYIGQKRKDIKSTREGAIGSDESGIGPNGPEFSAMVYSIEAFVPLLKLYLVESYAPIATTRYGKFLGCYLTIHIIVGWVLTTLWVGGLTGLVKG